MKYMVCPQCGISNFFIKNDKDERLNVKVSREFEIVLVDKSKSIDGFNSNVLYCLGCSWSGKITELKKFLIE